MQKKLFLLDAMGLIFRAYYALIKSPRLTSKGLNTSAILGFTNSLYEVIKKEKPTHIAVAFDTGAPTFRHAEFADYKANREATPDEIIQSVPYIKTILEAFRIPSVAMDGYEADDIVGTLAKHAEIQGFEVYMMTSDKDYGQLVSPHIRIYHPGKFGKPNEIWGVEDICEKHSIERPEQLIDLLGLMGDTSDNIPGVPGIGPVSAKKLIARYGSVEEMYARNLDADNEKMRAKLLQYKDQALMSKELATIQIDVPVEYSFDDMLYVGPDVKKLKAVFDELEFRSLSQRIFTDLSLQSPELHEADLFSQSESGCSDLPAGFPARKPVQLSEVKEAADINGDDWQSPAPVAFEWMMNEGKIAGFVFACDNQVCHYHYVEPEHRHYQEIIRRIFSGRRKIIMYEAKPTYKYLKAFRVEPDVEFFDISIAHYLIQPEENHELGRIAAQYLDSPPLMTADPDNLRSSAETVACLTELYPKLSDDLRKHEVYNLFRTVEMPLVEVLAEMEYNGVRVDRGILQQNSAAMEAERKELERQIYELAGETFNIASPKQLGAVLFEKLQIVQNAKLTKNKQYQTGEEVLVKMASKHPIVPLVLEWRKLTKLKSTYIDALPQLINARTGRIHSTFTQTVTATGRLSSVNPNLQNIPMRTERGRDIRKAFVASDDDHVMLAADYSQIELRIVAHVCGDERMVETFRRHEDIHAAMAARVYGVPLSEVTSDMRRSAKTVNFGILYGISAFGLADRLHITNREASRLIEDYFSSFPKILQYLGSTLEFARSHGYVETLMGRRRYIKGIDAQNAIIRKAAERNAVNAPIQGTAADLIKLAMIGVCREIRHLGLRSRLILQVHDELVFDVPKDEAGVLRPLVADKMSHAMQLSVPLDVDINEGPSWFEAH